MAEQETQIDLGRYVMEVGNSELDVLYRGRTDSLPRELHHQFVSRHPAMPEIVLSLKIREGGFRIEGRRIIPIPGPSGRIFFSQQYVRGLPSSPYDISEEDGEKMLQELAEVGL